MSSHDLREERWGRNSGRNVPDWLLLDAANASSMLPSLRHGGHIEALEDSDAVARMFLAQRVAATLPRLRLQWIW